MRKREPNYVEAWLERMDLDSRGGHDLGAFQQKLEDAWLHEYNVTDKQKSVLYDQYLKNLGDEGAAARQQTQRLWTQTPKGKYIPRLASKGIKRKTFKSRGRTVTRYIVPGRGGLFKLDTARNLFDEL